MADSLTEDERRELARLLVEGARLVLAKRLAEKPQAEPESAPASSRNESR